MRRRDVDLLSSWQTEQGDLYCTSAAIFRVSMSFQMSLIEYGSLRNYVDRLRKYDMKEANVYTKRADDSGRNPVVPQPHGKDSYRVRTGRI